VSGRVGRFVFIAVVGLLIRGVLVVLAFTSLEFVVDGVVSVGKEFLLTSRVILELAVVDVKRLDRLSQDVALVVPLTKSSPQAEGPGGPVLRATVPLGFLVRCIGEQLGSLLGWPDPLLPALSHCSSGFHQLSPLLRRHVPVRVIRNEICRSRVRLSRAIPRILLSSRVEVRNVDVYRG
jgi:hypothetical protein